MAYLIDNLLNTKEKIGHNWFVAKPLISGFLWWRIKDAWHVFTGRYIAVKFAKDEIEHDPSWVKNVRLVSKDEAKHLLDKAELKIAMAINAEESKTDMYGTAMQRESVNRNKPCPCGSGHKYKNCCMENKK
jgi:hypothetical protein